MNLKQPNGSYLFPSRRTERKRQRRGFMSAAERKRAEEVIEKHFKDEKGCDAEESETDSEEWDKGSCFGDGSWITWYCNLRGNDFFCEIDDDFLTDDFNRLGLSKQVPNYDLALDRLLDESADEGEEDEEQYELVETAAELLYGLLHARFIVTIKGLEFMEWKYNKAEFGRCPRVHCSGQPCLPVGLSDVPSESAVKIYCPKCEDIYTPKSRFQQHVDGAYFGTTFPHLFLMENGKPRKIAKEYVPRVFGFKLHKP